MTLPPSSSSLLRLCHTIEEEWDTLITHIWSHFIHRAPAPTGVYLPSTQEQPELLSTFLFPTEDQRAFLLATIDIAFADMDEEGNFGDVSAPLLYSLGRDLRKYGFTLEHYTPLYESILYGLCDILNYPYPTSPQALQEYPRDSSQQDYPSNFIRLCQDIDNLCYLLAQGTASEEERQQPATVSATVLSVERRSPHVLVVRLRTDSPFPFWTGQYVQVKIPQSPNLWVYLSPATPANPDGLIEFHISKVTQGRWSPLAVDLTQQGDHWVLANPTGGLEISNEHPATLIACSTGLAPLRALILDHANHPEPQKVHLIWAVRNPEELYDAPVIAALSHSMPWLSVEYWVESYDNKPLPAVGMDSPLRQGTILDALITLREQGERPLQGREVLIAGPPAVMELAQEEALLSGADPELIYEDPSSQDSLL